MSYGIVAYDATGDTVFDSNFAAFAYERKVTLSGLNRPSTSFFYATYDPLNPTAPVTSQILRTGFHDYTTDAVWTGDANRASAILAFNIPVGGFVYYYAGLGRVFASFASLQVAVLKPFNVLGNGSATYGATVRNANQDITWSSSWPLVRIQGPLRNATTYEETSWFALSGNTRRRLNSSGGPTGLRNCVVGLQRTSTTQIQCLYGLLDFVNFDGYGADTQDQAGLVLFNINV
jgi:hypothetical protein